VGQLVEIVVLFRGVGFRICIIMRKEEEGKKEEREQVLSWEGREEAEQGRQSKHLHKTPVGKKTEEISGDKRKQKQRHITCIKL